MDNACLLYPLPAQECTPKSGCRSDCLRTASLGSFKAGLFGHTCVNREGGSARRKKIGRRDAFGSDRYHSIGRTHSEYVHYPTQAEWELEKGRAGAEEVVAVSDLEAAVSDLEAAVPVRAVVVGHLVLAVLVLERHDREHHSPGRLRCAHVVPRLALAVGHLPRAAGRLPRAALRPPALRDRVLAVAMPGPGEESNLPCIQARGQRAK